MQIEGLVWRLQFSLFVKPDKCKADLWKENIHRMVSVPLLHYGVIDQEVDDYVLAVAARFDPDSQRPFLSVLCDYAEQEQRRLDTQAAALSAKAYQHNGLQAFRNSGSSNPERIVIGK